MRKKILSEIKKLRKRATEEAPQLVPQIEHVLLLLESVEIRTKKKYDPAKDILNQYYSLWGGKPPDDGQSSLYAAVAKITEKEGYQHVFDDYKNARRYQEELTLSDFVWGSSSRSNRMVQIQRPTHSSQEWEDPTHWL